MRRSHFVCAVIITLLGCGSLSFAETAKDYAKAVEYYAEALKLEPERPETIYVRGVNYDKPERYDDALADFNKVRDTKKIDRHPLNYIGLIYSAKKEYPATFKAFKGAADLQPKNLLYCFYDAGAAVKSDNLARTIDFCGQVLRIDPTTNEAHEYINTRIALYGGTQGQEPMRAASAAQESQQSEWEFCMWRCRGDGGADGNCEKLCNSLREYGDRLDDR